MHLGKPEAALKEFDEARAIYGSFHKADPSETAASVNAGNCPEKMGQAASRAGKPQPAEEYFHQHLAIVEPLLSAKYPDLHRYTAVDAYSGLGRPQTPGSSPVAARRRGAKGDGTVVTNS